MRWRRFTDTDRYNKHSPPLFILCVCVVCLRGACTCVWVVSAYLRESCCSSQPLQTWFTLHDFFEAMFPLPSSFERTDGPNPALHLDTLAEYMRNQQSSARFHVLVAFFVLGFALTIIFAISYVGLQHWAKGAGRREREGRYSRIVNMV